MNKIQPAKGIQKKVWHTFFYSSAWRWFQKAIVLMILFLVLNHLTKRESFPDGESYRFPIEGFLSSIALCILIGIIAHLNLKFYKKKYFSKKVEIVTITWYMASTLGYITIMYFPVNIIFNIVAGGQTVFLLFINWIADYLITEFYSYRFMVCTRHIQSI